MILAEPPLTGPSTDSPKNPKPKLDCLRNCSHPINDCKIAEPTNVIAMASNFNTSLFTSSAASKDIATNKNNREKIYIANPLENAKNKDKKAKNKNIIGHFHKERLIPTPLKI